ncbi:hypothetical protein MBLNU457_4785t1 [Dothideomycetes sp. NU457]
MGTCELKQRSALILYGSETGNAQDVAEEIGRLTQRLRFETTVLDLDSIEILDLLKHTIVIVALSTTGQGEFPQNARSFWRVLLSRRLRAGVLKRVNFTTFGLGDSSYPRYNVAHRMLHGRMLQLGAQLFCQRGEGNEQHPEGHSAGFREWIVDLKDSLLQHFPLPDGTEVIAEGTFIEPKWKLEQVQDEQIASVNGSTNGHQTRDLDAVPDDSLIPIKDSITATLVGNPRITPNDHFQDVRLMDFQFPQPQNYGPGAVAVIYPKNFPHDVQQFIEVMHWEHVADMPLKLVCTDPGASRMPPSPLRHIDISVSTLTLRLLLTNYLDILSIPRRSFFATLAYFAKEGNEDEQYQKERILELANPELIDELWDYTTRPRRTILEVMPDFPTVNIPWTYALSVLPIMRGRQFSIASGGPLKHLPSGNGHVQLLVAIANPPNPIIKYRKRFGVCTRYIATLQADQKINIGMQQGYLNVKPDEVESPVVLIGPGTGVAPMRSMIYERLRWSEERGNASSKPLDGTVLIYGCRNKGADYFFNDEWSQLESRGLQVFAAFSRDKDQPREYVQDVVRRQSALIHELLVDRRGKLYICGSSGNMPKGVRQALVEVLQERGGRNEADAEAYLDDMEKSGRYKQETW